MEPVVAQDIADRCDLASWQRTSPRLGLSPIESTPTPVVEWIAEPMSACHEAARKLLQAMSTYPWRLERLDLEYTFPRFHRVPGMRFDVVVAGQRWHVSAGPTGSVIFKDAPRTRH